MERKGLKMEMTMVKENVLVNVNLSEIYPHPDNPRKNLGDVSELSESIKKNGVMQNLTLIPGHWDANRTWFNDGYTLIIGHRRCEAARQAGLSKVPCRIISNMSEIDQQSTMLEENMQRSDLTPIEQSQGFQLMLDLGATEDNICEKTGFSKSTVKHRLNIAKLDQEILKNKEKEDGFQLSLTDLYQLEQIENIEDRNEILASSSSASDLKWKVERKVNDIKRDKFKNKLFGIFKEAGIEKAPKQYAQERYYGKWDVIKKYNFKDEEIILPKTENDKLYYYETYCDIEVVRKAKKKKKELTPEELKRKEYEKKRNVIRELAKEFMADLREFLNSVVLGKISIKMDEKEKDMLWRTLIMNEVYVTKRHMAEFLSEKNWYSMSLEEKKEVVEKINDLTVPTTLLITLYNAITNTELCSYQFTYNKDVGNKMMAVYDVFHKYGFSYRKEEHREIIEGTSNLYKNTEE